MPFVITEPCIGVKDATCLEVCPVDCINSDDDEEQYFIDPVTCID
ncbi:MAG: 4Fe-4S ferredoxin, partial [Chloroflexi bacterium]|nr:4Fe-4S ferredoxin [Chloroflexota bacterium]